MCVWGVGGGWVNSPSTLAKENAWLSFSSLPSLKFSHAEESSEHTIIFQEELYETGIQLQQFVCLSCPVFPCLFLLTFCFLIYIYIYRLLSHNNVSFSRFFSLSSVAFSPPRFAHFHFFCLFLFIVRLCSSFFLSFCSSFSYLVGLSTCFRCYGLHRGGISTRFQLPLRLLNNFCEVVKRRMV